MVQDIGMGSLAGMLRRYWGIGWTGVRLGRKRQGW